MVSVLALVRQAVRALLRHKTRSALNALGIMIGIASVVWVVAIGEAGSRRAQEQLHALGDNLVWVEAGSRNVNGVRTGAYGMRTLKVEDAEAILREVPTIRRVSPQIDGTVVAVHEVRNWTTRYRGVSPDYLEIKRWTIAEGRAFSDQDVEYATNVCLIGETVRTQLFGAEKAEGEVVRVAGQPFVVAGVLAPKGQSATGQDQDDTIFVPYTTGMKKLRGNGQVWLDDILCSATGPQDVGAAVASVTVLMRQRHHIGPEQEDDFNIRHPEELIHAQLEASEALELLLVSVALVSLLVGGIGVMNVMLASVIERTREIGVRLAVGAPGWAIEVQFLAEAVLLTAFGGALGVLASIGGSSVLARMLGWPITVPQQAIPIAVGFSVGIGILFGYAPARKAARLDPIEALRTE
ncbi:MAG TPA: ABC transporter permease [Polyangiaceae bacterium]|jgi:putative ABC transport system permease protein